MSKNLNYMRTLIIFTTFSFIILSSFGNHTYISTRNKYTSSEQIQKAKLIYHYKAVANGLADIYIKVFDDETFELYFRSLEDNIEATYHGTAYETKKNIILNFTSDKPILEALFDEKFDSNNAFKVISDSKVSIDKSKPYISLWGIGCEKL